MIRAAYFRRTQDPAGMNGTIHKPVRAARKPNACSMSDRHTHTQTHTQTHTHTHTHRETAWRHVAAEAKASPEAPCPDRWSSPPARQTKTKISQQVRYFGTACQSLEFVCDERWQQKLLFGVTCLALATEASTALHAVLRPFAWVHRRAALGSPSQHEA